ncbi:MAG: hypothetical protein KDA41_20955, partial [Planctomycetales bacterium]|nr:hypothetical protein [Planctomycetales bacterium]
MAEGIWNMRNDAPTRCVDADRFGWHVGRMGLALPSRLARGIVTAKEAAAYAAVAGYLRQFTSDAGAAARDFLAALDAMLFSGGQRWAADWHNLVVNAGLDHL